MILPDVNVLVHAFHQDGDKHKVFAAWWEDVLSGPEIIALADIVLTGFVRVVTNRRIFSNPSPMQFALQFVTRIRTSASARQVLPTDASWRQFAAFAQRDSYIVGNLVTDAWIASLAMTSGARVATADAGFARFEGLSWFNPELTG